MAEVTLLEELIKNLDQFDRKLIFVLDDLREKQNRMTLVTSRFELCRLLHFEYNSDNKKKLDWSLQRLMQTRIFLSEHGSGFSIAAKAISGIRQKEQTEKLILSLGRLFSI